MVIGAVFCLFAFDALKSGANRVSTIALALPLSIVLFDLTPTTMFLGPVFQSASSSIVQGVTLLLICVIMYVIVGRIVSFGFSSPSLSFSLLASLSTTIIIVIFWTATPALHTLWHFGPLIESIFAPTLALPWLLVSYLALAYVRS
jgi:hypothetical protein